MNDKLYQQTWFPLRGLSYLVHFNGAIFSAAGALVYVHKQKKIIRCKRSEQYTNVRQTEIERYRGMKENALTQYFSVDKRCVVEGERLNVTITE